MDLNDPQSEYSYERMALTENFAIFWEKGFGNDLSCAPELEGQDMTIDLEKLKVKLEDFYQYFYKQYCSPRFVQYRYGFISL